MPSKITSALIAFFVAALVLSVTSVSAQPCGWQKYAPYSNPLPAYASPCFTGYAGGNGTAAYIKSVTTTGGIVNITGPITAGCTGGYNYYSGTSYLCKANAGGTVNLSVALNSPSSTFLYKGAIFVDWNHDGTFDPVTEIVPFTATSQSIISGSATWSPSLTVPTWAQNGPTRMRIRIACNTSGLYAGIAGACDVVPTGDTKDFDFEVVNPCYEPAVISVSNITCNSAKIDWSTRGNATFYDVWVDQTLAPWSRPDAPGCGPGSPWCAIAGPPQPPCYCKFWNKFAGNQTTTQLPGPVNAHLRSNTKYYVCIRSICDTFQKPLFWTWDTSANWAIDSFITLPCCETPVVTVNQTTSTTATFSWNPVFTAHGYEYAVTTTPSNPPPSATQINATSVTVPGLTPSKTYYFYLRALCTPTPTSDWGETPFATLNTTSVTNVQGGIQNLYAYPNPVKNMLTIETEGVMHPGAVITVTDITGKLVQSLPMVDKKVNVNTAAWAPGFYMIKYSDEVSNKVIKITKQ